jgi:hypothetical protein
VSARERTNVEECECLLGLEDLHRGNLTCGVISFNWVVSLVQGGLCTLDDLAEDTSSGHFGTQSLDVLVGLVTCWARCTVVGAMN